MTPVFHAQQSPNGRWEIYRREHRMDWSDAIKQQAHFQAVADAKEDWFAPHAQQMADEIKAAFQEIERNEAYDHESV